MLASTLSLKPVSETAVDFAATKFLSDGSVRVLVSSTASDLDTLSIKHSSIGKNSESGQRHLIQRSKKVTDDTGSSLMVVNLTMQVPDDTTRVDQNDLLDMLREIIDLIATTASITLDSTTVAAICRGES